MKYILEELHIRFNYLRDELKLRRKLDWDDPSVDSRKRRFIIATATSALLLLFAVFLLTSLTVERMPPSTPAATDPAETAPVEQFPSDIDTQPATTPDLSPRPTETANSDAQPDQPEEPPRQTKPTQTTSCDPNYSPCVPVVSYDLDCDDIGFSVRVIGSDIHGFDREGDGYGCESY